MPRPSLLIVAAVLWAQPLPASGCGCFPFPNPCSEIWRGRTVFVGRTLTPEKESLARGRAVVEVIEAMHGVEADVERMEVRRRGCAPVLKPDRRYLVFARTETGGLLMDSCSPTFEIEGAALLVDAVRNSLRKGAARLVGQVLRKENHSVQTNQPVPGVTVVATSGKQRFSTTTDGTGSYHFSNIPPGEYRVSVSGDGYLPASTSWHYHFRDEPIEIASSGCAIANREMWPDGRIAGRIAGQPPSVIEGLEVEAFRVKDGEIESKALQGSPISNGRYVIKGLPPGVYIVGVNGKAHDDEHPIPPSFHPGVRKRSQAKRLSMGEAGRLTAIDFAVEEPRDRAVIEVSVIDSTGAALPNATVQALDPTGAGLAHISRASGDPARVRLDLYQGERYILEAVAHDFDPRRMWSGRSGLIDTTGLQRLALEIVATPEEHSTVRNF